MLITLHYHLQVEAYFIEKGWLLPTFHKSYWIGLNATSPASRNPAVSVGGTLQTSPATFGWIDKSAGAPTGRAYQHWGKAGSASEPNNLLGSENCGVANASAKYSLAWGWADTSCKISLPFICKSQREWMCCVSELLRPLLLLSLWILTVDASCGLLLPTKHQEFDIIITGRWH